MSLARLCVEQREIMMERASVVVLVFYSTGASVLILDILI